MAEVTDSVFALPRIVFDRPRHDSVGARQDTEVQTWPPREPGGQIVIGGDDCPGVEDWIVPLYCQESVTCSVEAVARIG